MIPPRPCPKCGVLIPFKKMNWRLGKPFSCAGCGIMLVLPRNLWLALVGLAVFYVLRIVTTGIGTLPLAVGVVVGVGIIQAVITKPRILESHSFK